MRVTDVWSALVTVAAPRMSTMWQASGSAPPGGTSTNSAPARSACSCCHVCSASFSCSLATRQGLA